MYYVIFVDGPSLHLDREKRGYIDFAAVGEPLFVLLLFGNLPRRFCSTIVPKVLLISWVLSKNKKNIKTFPTKFSIFTAEKILCILHGQVFE